MVIAEPEPGPFGVDVAEVLAEQAARLRRLGGLHARRAPAAGVLSGIATRFNVAGAYGWVRALSEVTVLGCLTDDGDGGAAHCRVLLTVCGVLHPWLPRLEVSVSVFVGGEVLLPPDAAPWADHPVDVAVLRRVAQAQTRQDRAWKTYSTNQRATDRREVLDRFAEGLPDEVRSLIKGL